MNWLFAYKTLHVQKVFDACLELLWKFEWRTLYVGALGVELIVAPLGMQNELVLALKEPI